MAGTLPNNPQPRAPPPEGFDFTSAPSLSAFQVPPPTFLSERPHFNAVAAGALVFTLSHDASPSSASFAAGKQQDRILLVQRAAHDSMPSLWETPGGACDADDLTVLHGLARELWEESGLRPRKVVRVVPLPGSGVQQRDAGAQVFFSRRGLRIGKFNFEVVVDVAGDAGADAQVEQGVRDREESAPRVQLDPNEHQRFIWATEEECRAGQVNISESNGGEKDAVDVKFTTKEQREIIFEGFRLRREASIEP